MLSSEAFDYNDGCLDEHMMFVILFDLILLVPQIVSVDF